MDKEEKGGGDEEGFECMKYRTLNSLDNIVGFIFRISSGNLTKKFSIGRFLSSQPSCHRRIEDKGGLVKKGRNSINDVFLFSLFRFSIASDSPRF